MAEQSRERRRKRGGAAEQTKAGGQKKELLLGGVQFKRHRRVAKKNGTGRQGSTASTVESYKRTGREAGFLMVHSRVIKKPG